MQILVDTHCHLGFAQFDADRDEVIARAREAGVRRILNPGIDVQTSRAAVKLSEQYAEVYAAVGVHPHSAASLGDSELDELRELARHPKVVAIGEIGLDYYRDLSPREDQRRAFKTQLDLAAECGKPVIIHNREAAADALALAREWAGALPAGRLLGVFHSFSGDQALASAVLGLNFALGLAGPLTYKKAEGLRAVAASAPLGCLLVETDAPFLTPQARRGARNEPAFVRFVAEKLAEVRGQELEVTVRATTANAAALFGWGGAD